ncbi:MAG: tRNA (adenosine(37)-N6)-threonylcarbamoyltransferase complex dimerization subunit type 1 TsaB [Proteobacteria bacterium]|nr:tRNA (adenosine(37)-N6)-threonylcarbamoyltransferase complex dimerization subunit type 1 TsaB [Pseudomonadota bacterium]
MKLLALDAATEWSSVALWNEGERFARELKAERGHGEQLLAMVDALLAQSGLALGGLDAIAFGRGPGAFTGLRLAASLAQGLAFSAGRPVIPVSNLRALAQQALGAAAEGTRVLACHDARMGEVYWAGFTSADGCAVAATEESVARPEAMLGPARAWLDAAAASVTAGVGNGFATYPALAPLAARLAPVLAEAHPRAGEIALLAARDGLEAAVPPERAWPVYVRDNVALTIAERSN